MTVDEVEHWWRIEPGTCNDDKGPAVRITVLNQEKTEILFSSTLDATAAEELARLILRRVERARAAFTAGERGEKPS